jgi:hypothetical protein
MSLEHFKMKFNVYCVEMYFGLKSNTTSMADAFLLYGILEINEKHIHIIPRKELMVKRSNLCKITRVNI